jgi:hypothetical protein
MSPAIESYLLGDGLIARKECFEETTRVTGKMVQIHHGAATVSGE